MTNTERWLLEAREIAERAVGVDVEQDLLRAIFETLCLEYSDQLDEAERKLSVRLH